MDNKVKLPADGVVFREGDAANKLYLIKRGQVLCLQSSNDRLIPVFLAKENDIIGESAMVQQLVYTYSAISISEVELIEVSTDNFKQVLELAPDWLTNLTTTMIARFQNTAKLIAENRVISPLIISEERFSSKREIEFKRLLNQ